MVIIRNKKGQFVKGYTYKQTKEHIKKIIKARKKSYKEGKWRHPFKGKRGEGTGNWKGGINHFHGYIYLFRPNHPFANIKGYVPEHRLVMENYLGRYLEKWELIHHKNRIKNDNRIENLILTISRKHFPLFHLKKIKCPKCKFEFGIK